jgi:hypothetical protein
MTILNTSSANLTDAHEDVFLDPPAGKPGFGENHAFWIHDEATGLHINGHIMTCEDIGRFDLRTAKLSIMWPNGRTLFRREVGGGSTAREVVGGNLRYTCVEPFREWKCAFDGILYDVTVERTYMSGMAADPHRVPVTFEIDTVMGAPAWVQGSLTQGGLGPVATFMGGERYEQLFKARGRVVIGGETIQLSGYGNRTHRFGHRDLTATATAPRMLGHVWTAGLFPSGAAFGLQTFPTADGGVLWGEAYIVGGGKMVGAEIVKAPWLRSYWRQGEPLNIVLRTNDGNTHTITGETLGTVITGRLQAATPGEQLSLFQGYARFHYKGESAINMLERSLRHSVIETGVGRPS